MPRFATLHTSGKVGKSFFEGLIRGAITVTVIDLSLIVVVFAVNGDVAISLRECQLCCSSLLRSSSSFSLLGPMIIGSCLG